MTFRVTPGERVLWQGKPHGIRGFLRPMDLFLLAFAALMALFFIGAMASSATPSSRDPGTFVIGALFPFVVFGLFFFVPRLVSIWREAAGAEYVVTERRVLIRGRGREVELDLANMPYLELERSWLSGESIFFGQRGIYEGWGGFYGGSNTPAFRGLSEAQRVYSLISDARSGARQR